MVRGTEPARAAKGRAAERAHDPLDEGHRVEWSTALLTFVEIAVAVPLAVLLLTGPGMLPRLFPALLVFLLVRIPADVVRAFYGPRPWSLVLEGGLKSAAWGIVPYCLLYAFTGRLPFGPLWVLGAALTLLGLSLWGHHARALPHAPEIAKGEGVTGAAITPLGIAALTTLVFDAPPGSVLVPALVLVLGGAIAARAIVRLLRRDAEAPMGTGWTGWYQAHFFRLTLLVAAVVVYLFLRDTLAGWIPFLFLFEYAFAVFVVAGFLWSLRGYAHSQVTDALPLSPHRKHEQRVERQGEPSFDRWEGAFGRFLDSGDTEDLTAAGRDLQESGLPVAALDPLLHHRTERGVLLVHPGWLYGARLSIVLLLSLGIAAVLPPPAGGHAALLVLALGTYSAQWNRYGGPWIVKPALGLVGLLFFLAFLVGTAGGAALAEPVLILGLFVAAALLAVHPFRASKGLPVPRFLYQGTRPEEAIVPLIAQHDRSLRLRSVWLGAIALLVFVVVSELSRVFPAVRPVFTLYLVIAGAFLVHPLLTTLGLRLGRMTAERRHAQARRRREALIEEMVARLGDTMERERVPRRAGPMQ